MASFKVDSVVVLFTTVVVLLLAINCGAGAVHSPSGGEEVVGDPHKYEDAKLKEDDQQAREKASETSKEAKDQASSDTWTEWAKEKLNEGLGLAKDNVQDASHYVTHSAMKSTDKVQDTTYATGEYGAEKAGDSKNKATEKACEIKNKAGDIKDSSTGKADEIKNKASDKAGDIKDSSTGKADEIKKKASSTDQEAAKHSSMETGKSAIEESEEQLRKAAEKAKHGSDQPPKGKAGETLEATKERLDANYEAAKKKTENIKERFAGGGRDGDEEL